MYQRGEKNKRHTSWNSFIRRRTNKFGATPTGGYASKKEYWDAVFLKDLEAQGIISNLRQQVRYDFRINGKLLKHYAIVDFQFEINGKVVWYETKGFVDKVYPLKREIIEATLPDGHVYLVNASEAEIRNV